MRALPRTRAHATQNQAFSALLFLYRDVLDRELNGLDESVRAKRPQRIPQVLSPVEVQAILRHLRGVPLLMACLMYGEFQSGGVAGGVAEIPSALDPAAGAGFVP